MDTPPHRCEHRLGTCMRHPRIHVLAYPELGQIVVYPPMSVEWYWSPEYRYIPRMYFDTQEFAYALEDAHRIAAGQPPKHSRPCGESVGRVYVSERAAQARRPKEAR